MVPRFLQPLRRPGAGLGSVPVPPSSAPRAASSAFTPGATYAMVVWPIPQGIITAPTDPATILRNLGFAVRTSVMLGDGSTVIVAQAPAAAYTPSASDASDVLVFRDGVASDGTSAAAFQHGETIRGDQSGTLAEVYGSWDDPTSRDGVLSLLAFVGTFFQVGEAVRGVTSGSSALVAYQYGVVLRDPKSGALLGVSQLSQQTAATSAPPGGFVHLPLVPLPVTPKTPVAAGGTGPTTPTAASTGMSTGTIVAVGAAVVVVGFVGWYALRRRPEVA